MSPEKTKILFEKFSHLYAGRNLSIKENLMTFGFDCGDGWFDLLYRLSKDIVKIDPDCRATQVKEKFGGLRFYTELTSDACDKRISDAAEESHKTCERCGNKGTTTNLNGWRVTLCATCAIPWAHEG